MYSEIDRIRLDVEEMAHAWWEVREKLCTPVGLKWRGVFRNSPNKCCCEGNFLRPTARISTQLASLLHRSSGHHSRASLITSL